VTVSFLLGVLEVAGQLEADEVARDQLAWLQRSAGRGNRHEVAEAERTVQQNPGTAFEESGDGLWLLRLGETTRRAGAFTTPSLADLEADLRAKGSGTSGRLTFSVLLGSTPHTDIGGLQAASPGDWVFQVASQFNCLESPGLHLVPVSAYFTDPTQGPRAAVGAYPATLLRHYHAPDPSSGWYTQKTDGRQVELLASACGSGVVRNGYLTGEGLENPREFADCLDANWDQIRVGFHDDIEIVLGFDWDGAVQGISEGVSQVLTSTVAGGGYGGQRSFGSEFGRVVENLLRASYFGTLAQAALAKKRWVVLTLIGGGVFGNPVELIWESILWGLDRVEALLPSDLHVVLNGRDVASRLDPEGVILPAVRGRSGRVCQFDESGLASIRT